MNAWVVRLQWPDGVSSQAQFGPSVFKGVRGHAFGQVMLQAWFLRSRPDAQAAPKEEKAER
jgi:hypothetical protein